MSSTIDEVLLKSETKDIFIRNLMSSLILTTKSANELPQKLNPSSLNYFHTFTEFSKKNEDCVEKISSLMKSIVDFVKGFYLSYHDFNVYCEIDEDEVHLGQVSLPVRYSILYFITLYEWYFNRTI